MSERVHKSILNAEVNLVFYFLSLFLSFFSRKVFLDCLGASFIGLTGTLGNILGYLNLAELGIGGCISIFLYKPLQNKNRQEINEIISVFGYLYRIIGTVILIAGIIVSLFFPLIFTGETDFGLGIIYFSFFSLLGSSLIGYFINYRQIILSADQKNYIVSGYFQTANLVKTIIQILLVYNYKNLFLWVAIEFVFSVICCIILNWKINREYPWLKSDKSRGSQLLKKYPDILPKTRQIFIHQIKDFVLGKSDELFVFAFVSLQMVAYYSNYIILVTKATQFFTRAQDGLQASVGNLIAEDDKDRIMKVFWELMSLKYFIAGFLCFSIFHLAEPFISLWLGSQYILSHEIIVLLVIYTYMTNIRGVVDFYNHSYGLYADTWSAWAELIINVSITILLGLRYGIIGILLGKIVSVMLIVMFWKPYYLFSSGLKLPVSIFWKGTLRYHAIFLVSFFLVSAAIKVVPINPYDSYWTWMLYALCCITLFILLESAGFYFFTPGTKDLMYRIRAKR